MSTNKLRQLVYSCGGIAVLGIGLALFALESFNTSATRADAAFEDGTAGLPVAGAPGTSGEPALAAFERATSSSREAALYLGLSATLTPLLIFLNVLGFTGQHAPESPERRLRALRRLAATEEEAFARGTDQEPGVRRM